MHSQQTEQEVINKEKQVIVGLLSLNDGTNIVLNDSGWDSRTYIINSGEIVFKFPRSEQVKNYYKLEIAGYKLARQIKSEVAIPQVKWEHHNLDYFGYQGIVGIPLEHKMKTLTPERRENLGKELGAFLKILHELKLDAAPMITLEKEVEEFQHKFQLGLPEIKKHFRESEQKEIQKLIFEIYPNKIMRLGTDKGLCHGDLGCWNMIYGNDGRLGIVDFGDIGYWDRSMDFIGINEEDVLNAALETYGDREVFREKIELRKHILPILDLVYFVSKNKQEGIQKTISKIREVIS